VFVLPSATFLPAGQSGLLRLLLLKLTLFSFSTPFPGDVKELSDRDKFGPVWAFSFFFSFIPVF